MNWVKTFSYKINVGKTNLVKSKVTKLINVIFHILQHSLQISIQQLDYTYAQKIDEYNVEKPFNREEHQNKK